MIARRKGEATRKIKSKRYLSLAYRAICCFLMRSFFISIDCVCCVKV